MGRQLGSLAVFGSLSMCSGERLCRYGERRLLPKMEIGGEQMQSEGRRIASHPQEHELTKLGRLGIEDSTEP